MASLCSPPSPSWWLPLKGPEVGTKDWSGIKPTFPFQSRLAGTPCCICTARIRPRGDSLPWSLHAASPSCNPACGLCRVRCCGLWVYPSSEGHAHRAAF